MATRPEFAGQWSQAGGIARYGFAGMFWKAVPEKDWPQDEEYLESIKKQWVEPFGDMRQELVFIGQRLQKEKMIAALDACLLSEEDVLKGREYWSTFNDPFCGDKNIRDQFLVMSFFIYSKDMMAHPQSSYLDTLGKKILNTREDLELQWIQSK